LLCDEILCSPSHVELLIGMYEVLVPALIDSLQQYQTLTNPLADAPSVRINRFCLLEMNDLKEFGRQSISVLVSPEDRRRLQDWISLLRTCLDRAGGISGRDPKTPDVVVSHDTTRRVVRRYEYDPVPKRDDRFHDSYNAGVNPEAFLYNDRFSPRDKVLMMFYKRLRELDVPEMMASIIYQTKGKPWEFYRDMSRQLWDEARHAMLGEAGFDSLELDWTKIPINFTWSLNLNTQLTPEERHAVLFFIEQGLMPKTGKRFEWEVALGSQHPLAALIQDFDWADEVLHSQIGREWYVKPFGDLNAALDYGDRCWSKVMSHWREYFNQGLTAHRNWWPELYETDCRNRGIKPDPNALGFNISYESIRADLSEIAPRSE